MYKPESYLENEKLLLILRFKKKKGGGGDTQFWVEDQTTCIS